MSKSTKLITAFGINKEQDMFYLEISKEDKKPFNYEDIIKAVCEWALDFKENHKEIMQEALLAQEMLLDFDDYDSITKH